MLYLSKLKALSASSAKLIKLQIIPLKELGKKADQISTSDAFKVLINPTDLTHNFKIVYNEQSAQGDAHPGPKFNKAGRETLNFDIIIDGTGVVKEKPTDPPKDVSEEINKIRTKFGYDGSIHEPKFAAVLWGTMFFQGIITKLDIKYTLFNPSGKPLRAKIGFGFLGYTSTEESAKLARKSSPDLTHIVTTKAGDTLPLLCEKIYKDASYYPEVAKVNGFSTFRFIKPGTKIFFPPLS